MGFVFEFDLSKSIANKSKHGIDFVEAQVLWSDDDLIVGPAESVDEERWLAIGTIEDKRWTACFTFRDTVIRLISVRRARTGEEKIYESQRL